MNQFLILYRNSVCFEVTKFATYSDAQVELDKVLLDPSKGISGTIYSTDAATPGVRIGDMLSKSGFDEFDYADDLD